MISIDTNVLLRYLLQDDEAQSNKANKLFSGRDSILITDIVLAETAWTLRGKKYKFAKEELLTAVDGLFRESSVRFEDGQSVWRALHSLRASKPVKVGSKKKDVDFADLLILEKSIYDSKRKSETLECLYSFDKAAQQVDGIESP